MPYVITTKQKPSAMAGLRYPRTAVATLAEAREVARDGVESALLGTPHGTADVLNAHGDVIEALPESGGTIGPLPDGTVIEVAPVTYADLLDRIGVKFIASADPEAAACREFNAAQ